jgi:AraC-like DNA-binding protein
VTGTAPEPAGREAARELGFTEATSFGTFFVRETGIVPDEFRRTYR